MSFVFSSSPSPRRRYAASLVAVFCALLSLLTVSRSALAQSEADRATARALAREGYDALKSGDYETAEDRFRRADELVHAPTLVVDHARALVGLGRLVEAQERYELVIREGVERNAPASWKRALKNAREEVEAVHPRIAWLTVKVYGAPDPKLWVDGAEVPPAAIGVKRAADPGTRAIVASAEDCLTEQTEVELEPGEAESIEITLMPDPDAAAAEPTPTPAPPPASPAQDTPTSQRDYLMYGALGVGAAGVITGAVTGIMWLGLRSDLKSVCDSDGTGCDPDRGSDVDRYNLLNWVTPISFGLGAAGLGLGGYLFFTREDSSANSARVGGYLTPTEVGLMGQF